METAVFGGGCFWCTEAVFKMLRGVRVVKSGYTGGNTPDPTYAQVSTGTTGHVEVIHIEYDPRKITYEDLLAVFFGSHDPTEVNRQGHDVGTQYRSVIFYTTDMQKESAEHFIKELNASSHDGKPIATSVEPLGMFYESENYHHDYYENNKEALYCTLIINPKLEKVQQRFAALLKQNESEA